MVEISAASFFCQGDQDNPAVLLASGAGDVSFFDKVVDGNRERAYRDRHRFCHSRHVSGLINPDRGDDVHIIIGYILKFFCNDCFFFDIHNFVEKIYQKIRNGIVAVHVRHLSF